MPIPNTRVELTNLVHSTFEKLRAELEAAGSKVGSLHCVDDWSVKDLLAAARRESYRSVRARLERGFERVMRTIDSLDDRELLAVGVFAWSGKYPISRWISMNTARQYTTARTFIRRALREHRG
jgi:hypothetical protein